MTYNVFRYEPYENYFHDLEDATADQLQEYLLANKYYLDDLVIIEGRVVDNGVVLRDLGMRQHRGKAAMADKTP